MNLILEYLQSGGIIIYAILAVSFYAWLQALRGLCRVYLLYRILGQLNQRLKIINKNPIVRVRKKLLENLFSKPTSECMKAKPVNLNRIVNVYSLWIGEHQAVTDYYLRSLKTFSSILPLMGLLGTIVGMLETFSGIRDFGMENPSLLTMGIRQALLTTQAGLVTALPVFLLHHIISGIANKTEHRDEQVQKILLDNTNDIEQELSSNYERMRRFGKKNIGYAVLRTA